MRIQCTYLRNMKIEYMISASGGLGHCRYSAFKRKRRTGCPRIARSGGLFRPQRREPEGPRTVEEALYHLAPMNKSYFIGETYSSWPRTNSSPPLYLAVLELLTIHIEDWSVCVQTLPTLPRYLALWTVKRIHCMYFHHKNRALHIRCIFVAAMSSWSLDVSQSTCN